MSLLKLSVGQLVFVVIVVKIVHQKALLVKQYSVISVGSGFWVHAACEGLNKEQFISYLTNLASQFTMLFITVI